MRHFFLLLLCIVTYVVQAEQKYSIKIFTDGTSFKCSVYKVYNKSDKKVYKPNDSVNSFRLEFIREMNEVIIRTKNYTSTYTYSRFVDLEFDWFHLKKHDLGINYRLHNDFADNYLDIFENGKVVLEVNSKSDPAFGTIITAYCSDLRLFIEKI